jgi:hypothetical protein
MGTPMKNLISPPLFETLEARRLMWATVDDGILVVNTAPQPDQSDPVFPVGYTASFVQFIVIADMNRPGDLYVDIEWNGRGGTVIPVSGAGVHGIRMEGTSGNDVLIVSDQEGKIGLPVTILGGAGDDILFGASENDVLIGGDGNDLARGFAGSDVIDAERGIDYDPSQSIGNAYFSRFQNGQVAEDSAFANDPLESDPADILTGSAEWSAAIAKALGQPAPVPAPAMPSTQNDSAPVLPPALAPALSAPAVNAPIFATSEKHLWDDAA